jgi:hypothetical protein
MNHEYISQRNPCKNSDGLLRSTVKVAIHELGRSLGLGFEVIGHPLLNTAVLALGRILRSIECWKYQLCACNRHLRFGSCGTGDTQPLQFSLDLIQRTLIFLANFGPFCSLRQGVFRNAHATDVCGLTFNTIGISAFRPSDEKCVKPAGYENVRVRLFPVFVGAPALVCFASNLVENLNCQHRGTYSWFWKDTCNAYTKFDNKEDRLCLRMLLKLFNECQKLITLNSHILQHRSVRSHETTCLVARAPLG